MDERLQRLQNSAVEGDVDALFSIIAEDPLVLERIDEMSFVTTPLHAAVSGGNIHFVKEILNLKPSFVGKRDHLGRGLLHLALEGKHLQERRSPRDLELEEKYQELVTWLIKIHPELVRVKARGMVTPLHYAAELNDETNLANFLYVCPSSMEDLTVKSETAIHVAIKNRSFTAFKVLLGWLRHFDKEEILKWENEEGNNALHTAISENQPEPEVVKLLIKCMNVNRKNGKGLTALDIYLQRSLNPEVKQILLGAKAKRASQLNPRPNIKTRLILKLLAAKNYSFVDFLCGELAPPEVFIRIIGLGDRIIKKIPLEVQNVVLVVAILIATATYQATLSPPGGFWQDDDNNSTAVIKTSPFSFSSNIFLNPQFYRGRSEHVAGHMIQGSTCHLYFLVFNTVAFSSSVSTIIIVTSGLRYSKIIGISTTLIVLAYTFAVTETSPYPVGSALWYFFYILVFLIGGAAYGIPFLLYLRGWMLEFYGPKKLSLGSLEQPKI